MKEYIISGISDNGTKTEQNQDACFVGKTKVDTGEVVFAAVCDGMGGTQSGELASATIIEEARNWFYSKCDLAENWYFDDNSIHEEWENIFVQSNNRILEYGRNNGITLGSTAAFVLVSNDMIRIMNIGDTRIYEIAGGMRKLNYDHSVVGQEIASGKITEEEAKTDKRNNMLTQCIGMLDNIIPYYAVFPVAPSSSYFICSDGFYNRVSNVEIEERLKNSEINSTEDLDSALHTLVNMDRMRGERDDITVVAVVSKEDQPE